MLCRVVVLVSLVICATAQEEECAGTQAVYPKTSSNKMTDITTQKNIECDMFTYSCCTFVTEFKMKAAAAEWGEAVVGSYGAASEILDNRRLYPVDIFTSGLIPTTVISSIEASLTYGLPLNKAGLTKLALTASSIQCSENSAEYSMISQYMQQSVDNIADSLTALMKGLTSLKSAYKTIEDYTVSEECKRAIMKNGVSTRPDLQNNNCQVCSSDTAAYGTCKNTCMMAVSGCYNELVNVYQLTRQLLLTLDSAYYNIQLQLQDEYMDNLRYMATTYPECFASDFIAFNDPANAPAADSAYYSATLQLMAASLKEGIQYACSGSSSNSNCFTSGGITASDSTPQIEFSLEAQKMNFLLPLTGISEEVTAVEDDLKAVISEVAVYADASSDSTPGPSTSPYTPTAPESVLGDSNGGTTALLQTCFLATVLWTLG